jgi:peptide deformylase
MTDVIQKNHPVLRKKAVEVSATEFGSEKISALTKRMSHILAREPHGVALAAPQIGESLRMFIVSGLLFARRDDEGTVIEEHPDLVFINPQLISRSQEKEWVEEGCLSVEGFQGMVERSREATVEAYDERGKRFTLAGTGLLAQIFQHELDHLDGILYIDKACHLQKLSPRR